MSRTAMLDSASPAVVLEGVEYRYHGVAGAFHLGPVNLRIPPGSLSFWIGPNGSGKSTLARIVAGEFVPDEGAVLGTGKGVLYHHQSLEENIFPTLRVCDHLRLASAANGAHADVMHHFPELSSVKYSYPDQLSGGQLQLLAFAALVLRSCRLYILDEVLNHLDRPIAGRVLSWIRSHLVHSDSSVVIISHDLSAAAEEADEVVIFADGRVTHELRRSEIGGDPGKLLRLLTRELGGGDAGV